MGWIEHINLEIESGQLFPSYILHFCILCEFEHYNKDKEL